MFCIRHDIACTVPACSMTSLPVHYVHTVTLTYYLLIFRIVFQGLPIRGIRTSLQSVHWMSSLPDTNSPSPFFTHVPPTTIPDSQSIRWGAGEREKVSRTGAEDKRIGRQIWPCLFLHSDNSLLYISYLLAKEAVIKEEASKKRKSHKDSTDFPVRTVLLCLTDMGAPRLLQFRHLGGWQFCEKKQI